MEKKIGETFQHGNQTFEVCHAKEYKSCHGCAFCEPDGNRCMLNRVENDVPECIGLHRADGLNVIFVAVDDNVYQKAKRLAEEFYPSDKYIEAVREAFCVGYLLER